ncbi:2-oxoacid:acceptor oxidoreductase subunit alpha [Leptolyngbya sp. FACHB-261]|uniref:2-oxoacid:acceptor oxidoreductase subunit alpha n=1 Tax=Leptolyngbya sp. FACHB-261 TaxID=2692806 RepID=UPI00168916F6|nr:2-oxoacid:acceptor oxidoreductase subunit alpha [Leptolyngbya sp. FACHB-261]MBD2104876.1 2-oxoacid:acceptor oxidoreductase subunit alpha [Leptolyngbya sp. FACHB-261]
MTKASFVLRIAGESGEGVISSSETFARALAKLGYWLFTYRTFPAEIKGGPALFQMRVGSQRLSTQGDSLDLLLAYNQYAFDHNVKDLASASVVVYDSEAVTIPNDFKHQAVGVPFGRIAREEIGFPLAKNVVALGVLSQFFPGVEQFLQQAIEKQFKRKGEEIIGKNKAALQAGLKFTADLPTEVLRLTEPNVDQSRLILSGNQMIAMGAIAAGCRAYFGYPITPATDIMEFLAGELPKVGGVCQQVEDEISAVMMAVGASYAGVPAMTATSGPGLSLMGETLGYAWGAEIPIVVVDSMRAGPSTGMPTKMEQSDLNIALHGSHGDTARVVIAPTDVEDCFWQTIRAFQIAETYQVPVVLLSDITLSNRTESVQRPDLSQVKRAERLTYTPSEVPYLRFDLTSSGVSPMAVPGQPNAHYVASGLEHTPSDAPCYTPENHEAQTEKRFRKLEQIRASLPAPEILGDPSRAEVGLITWGTAWGPVQEAVKIAQAQGHSVSAMVLRTLNPFPTDAVQDYLRGVRWAIAVESNFQGQLAHLIQAHTFREVDKLRAYGGVPFSVARILEAIAAHNSLARPVSLSR